MTRLKRDFESETPEKITAQVKQPDAAEIGNVDLQRETLRMQRDTGYGTDLTYNCGRQIVSGSALEDIIRVAAATADGDRTRAFNTSHRLRQPGRAYPSVAARHAHRHWRAHPDLRLRGDSGGWRIRRHRHR